MFAKRSFLAGMVLNGLVFWSGSALAQKEAGQAEPALSLSTVSLQFPGGTLADYVKALKEAAPKFNIVLVVPEAKDIRLPAIKLDSVSYYPSLQLLQGEYRVEDGSLIKLLVNDIGGPREGEDASPVYKIWSERLDFRKPLAQVRVWNIGDLLGDDRKADAVLTAVETAVGLLDGVSQPAKIRYHQETKLLVASGENAQLAAIDRVVGGVREGTTREKELTAAMLNSEEAVKELSQWLEEYQKLTPEEQRQTTPDGKFTRLNDLAGAIERVRMAGWQDKWEIGRLQNELDKKEKK